jgi:hypothetical protein
VLVHLADGSAADEKRFFRPAFLENSREVEGMNKLMVVNDADAKAIARVKFGIICQPFLEEARERPTSSCDEICIGEIGEVVNRIPGSAQAP